MPDATPATPAGQVVRLVDLAEVVRSKNAGPFTVTLDVMLGTEDALAAVVASGVLSAATIATRYRVPAEDVRVVVFPPAHAVKITLPRRVGSGSAADVDVYGTQQHIPLYDLEVPIAHGAVDGGARRSAS